MTAGWAATADRVLPRLLRRWAGERPDAPFLRIEDGPAETFAQVLAAAERIAGQLAGLGVAPGDLVPLLAETSAPSVHAWLGVNLAGAADVPLNTAYHGASLAHGVGLGRARLMIADPSFLPRIAEVAADLPGTARLRVIPLSAVADGPAPAATVLYGEGVTCGTPRRSCSPPGPLARPRAWS